MVTIDDVHEAVSELGLSGRPVCLHTSLRSFGRVDGGAMALVQGFLSAGCTVLVPTFSYLYAISPPAHLRPKRNGWNHETASAPTPGGGRVYRPESTEIDLEYMGAVPSAVLRMPERARGNHPLNSFAAVGPLAEVLISGQDGTDVYAPLRELSERGGWLVLAGVGLTKMTFLHLAEQMVGRTLFRRWANGPDGQATMVAAGGCSDGFGRFEPMLASLVKEKQVGKSHWRVYPAPQVLEAAVRALREDPSITHCGDQKCERCRDAVQGGPIL